MKVKRTADLTTRGVILSSDLVEICANHSKTTQITEKTADGKGVKKKITTIGVGILHAAGHFGKDPFSSQKPEQSDAVLGKPVPLNQWVAVAIVGLRGKTELYIDGHLVGSTDNQMGCPLKRLGSPTGNSFAGTIKDLKIWNRALCNVEIGRAAGLVIAPNLAGKCPASAFASDTAYGLTADLMVDDDGGTRWSSGPTRADGWVAVDLGSERTFSKISLNFARYVKRAAPS